MFYFACAVLALICAAIVLRPLVRPRAVSDQAPSKDMAIFRAQLDEIDRDVARGTLDRAEAERTRTEIARRMLAADKAERRAVTDGPGRPAVLLGVLAPLIVAGAAGLYWILGAAGAPDFPMKQRLIASEEARADRLSQAEMIAELGAPPAPPLADAPYLEMIEKLRSAVSETPDDLEGQKLLAQHEANLGQFDAAISAQKKVIALQDTPPIADRVLLLDLMVYQVRGYVSPEAEAVAREILTSDPQNAAGHYYIGLLYDFTDRPDLAFKRWLPLVERPGRDPHQAMARRMIMDTANRAGIDYTPPSLPGPSAEEMAAAEQMSPEDRQAMIQGMVDQLTERLATEGGSAEEWARLINALGVLGQTERAQAIYDEAKTRFDGRDGISSITEAANKAGLQ